jgi:hypothetical protein
MDSRQFEEKIKKIFNKWSVKEYNHMGQHASGLHVYDHIIEVWETAFGNEPTCIKRLVNRDPTMEDVAELGKNHYIRMNDKQQELINDANAHNQRLRDQAAAKRDENIERMIKGANWTGKVYVDQGANKGG